MILLFYPYTLILLGNQGKEEETGEDRKQDGWMTSGEQQVHNVRGRHKIGGNRRHLQRATSCSGWTKPPINRCTCRSLDVVSFKYKLENYFRSIFEKHFSFSMPWNTSDRGCVGRIALLDGFPNGII
ncbi:hypothetical protein PoB_001024800 [Plakobranchus ocellatus]|uniref:Uncharacterized protein n=1 Tax=Plakobranchus ocellatus TaxID=259542 RepID=A0AAV3YN19_9GAST|nr:hypothetical protein PoB_001024800 [Plakobranchus ocellatus]